MKMSFGLALFAVGVGLVTVELLAAEPAAVQIETVKDHIDFMAGKDLVGRYNIGANVAKPYMWPLNGPGGVRVTRSWPMEEAAPGGSTDHPHQKSVWFCHGDVIPEGLQLKVRSLDKKVQGVDFWSEGLGHGRIVCTHVGDPKVEKNHGQITTRNEWRTADGIKVMDETRTIHLYDLGEARLFVFDIDLHASTYPITFGDTKEGSFGVRVNDLIREDKSTKQKGDGKIENADGKGR